MSWRTIHTCKQWQVQVTDDPSKDDYRIVNLATDGTRQYYQALCGKYGEPLLEPEPDLAVAVPKNCVYQNKEGDQLFPDQRISGLICRNAIGEVSLRVSLTNARNKNISWSLNDEGVLTVDGESYYLYALVQKDKNRILNYDAFFGAAPVNGSVEVLELEDLV